jgi:hypothetical protein
MAILIVVTSSAFQVGAGGEILTCRRVGEHLETVLLPSLSIYRLIA